MHLGYSILTSIEMVFVLTSSEAFLSTTIDGIPQLSLDCSFSDLIHFELEVNADADWNALAKLVLDFTTEKRGLAD